MFTAQGEQMPFRKIGCKGTFFFWNMQIFLEKWRYICTYQIFVVPLRRFL